MLDNHIIDPNDSKQLELYVHIPFCAKKCNYCDFLSFPMKETEHDAYIRKLCEEIERSAPQAAEYEISTVFIGGGTPSLLDPKYISRVLYTIRRFYTVRKNAEISIECNPASTIAYKFAAYRDAGINRLSIGLQSANNEELRRLGRIHLFEDFLKCYQSARMEGFRNISIDLMNDIPGQTERSWRETLRHVLMLKPEHVSIYNLIVEEDTPFMRMQEDGTLQLPPEDTQSAIDALTRTMTEKYGYQRYEVSNYAKPGFACRHNYGYWSDVPYLGFGLGAASCTKEARWSNLRDYDAYLALDLASEFRQGCPVLHAQYEKRTQQSRMEEFMFLGLRRTAGISEVEFQTRFLTDIHRVFGTPLRRYTGLGLLIHDGYRYRFSERGMDVSNIVLSDFVIV